MVGQPGWLTRHSFQNGVISDRCPLWENYTAPAAKMAQTRKKRVK